MLDELGPDPFTPYDDQINAFANAHQLKLFRKAKDAHIRMLHRDYDPKTDDSRQTIRIFDPEPNGRVEISAWGDDIDDEYNFFATQEDLLEVLEKLWKLLG